MEELKQEALNKRDLKAIYKNYDKPDADKRKEMKKIWFELKDNYINSLMGPKVDPSTWIKNEYPKDGNEIVHYLVIEGKL